MIKASGFLPARPAPPPVGEARLAAAAGAEPGAPTSHPTIQFRAGDSANRLFLLPGVDGNMEEVRETANLLRNPSATVAVGFHPSSVSVDQIISETVTEILRIQPCGPYNLCGYSFGGLVAFAAAARLREAGHEVRHLTLIATPIPRKLWPAPILMASVWGRTRRFAGRGVRGAAAVLAAKAVGLTHAIERKLALAPRSERREDLRVASFRGYRPGFYTGMMMFIQTSYDKEFWCDFGQVWARHAQKVDIHTLETSHVGAMRDPAMVRQVAELIDSQLSEST